MNNNSIASIAKRIDMKHNVSIRVIDEVTGQVVSEHTGHNAATNSLLTGIAHYLTGDGVLNQGEVLALWVPQYISLGTMGLISQDEDEFGLPAGIGNVPGTEEDRFKDYMMTSPGYGADGYDSNLNNNRQYLGLGPMFSDREAQEELVEILKLGDINQDGKIDDSDLHILFEYITNIYEGTFSEKQKKIADINQDGVVDQIDAKILSDFLESGEQPEEGLGSVTVKSVPPTVRCELITPDIHRAQITYREIVPEIQAEHPETIDVVFSAFVSTGALSKFREPGKDYIFITEAGLWSRPDWVDGGDNGLLAGYRICPPDEENWDMSDPSNRELLKKNIIKIGPNQVAQIIWKIQIGAIEQLGEVNSGACERLQWIVW